MKKLLGIIVFVIIATLSYILVSKTVFISNELGLGLASSISDQENKCFDRSYKQITDSLLTTWDTLFKTSGVRDNPFAMMLYFIEYFRAMDQDDRDECFSLQEIIANNSTNLLSSVIATCAIMQKMGWDFQYFHNKNQ